jgi:L-aspartate oxidase
MLIPRGLLAGPMDRSDRVAEDVDVLVVGSGVAGLSAALAVPEGLTVLLATKDRLGHSATRYAQGGIAAVLDPGGSGGLMERGGSPPAEGPDSVAEHVADTLAAGAGLCDPAAVKMLAAEGGQAIAGLRARGVRFDQAELDGELARTREGGHSRSRVVHAGGDATGAELERALTEAVRAAPAVRSAEHAFLVDLVTTDGRVTGALLWSDGGPRPVRAGAVVLASGGAGQLYADTTNPPLSTGDGVAAALRAGAVLADLEFVQFHPTALHVDGDPRPLISEAMRGEGAVLRDGDGTPLMAGVHPLGDLAPRDAVTRAMAARMAATGARHLWLDATSIPAEQLERRFPTILARCRAAGIDPSRQPIPVSPAAHYLMGGVATDLDGRTSLPGLFAVGEAACTGVHGANRLASNSLLEGVVFAARIGRVLGRGPVDNPAHPPHPFGYAPPPGDPTPAGPGSAGPVAAGRGGAGRGAAGPGGAGPGVGPGVGPEAGAGWVRGRVRRLMTDRVGVVRSGEGLAEAMGELERLTVDLGDPGPEVFEAANLVQLGRAVAELAARREESRGGHWRSDHPAPVDAWRVRQTLARTADGGLEAGLLAVPEDGGGPLTVTRAVGGGTVTVAVAATPEVGR